MTGKFVLKKGSTGKYHFNLVATNGQVIATSESYESKASALNGIESVKKNAPNAQIDDQTSESARTPTTCSHTRSPLGPNAVPAEMGWYTRAGPIALIYNSEREGPRIRG